MSSFKQSTIDYLTQVLPPFPGGAPMRVLNAYPTKPELMPCVSVNQAGGSLEIQTIGQGWSEPEQQPDGTWIETEGAYYRESVEVMVWTTNPRLRDWLAPVMRKALWKMVRHFSDTYDVQKMTISEQGDGQDLESRGPVDTFTFHFEVSALVGITEEIPLPVGGSFELGGNLGPEAATTA